MKKQEKLPASPEKAGDLVPMDGQLVDPQRIDPRPGGGRSRRRGRWVPVLIVAVLVAAGVAVAVRMAAHRSAPSDEPVVRTNRYEVGSCVTISPGPMVSILSCGRPNSGRVKATTDYPRPCPSGTETVSVVAEQVSVCLSGTSPSPGDLPGS